MESTNLAWAQGRAARLEGIAAALFAVVAVASIASSAATAAKPVPTIAITSCKLVTGGSGSLAPQITIAWTRAGKLADPTFIEVYVETTHADGSFDDANTQRRGFTKAELKANETTFVFGGLGLVAGDTVTVTSAQWVDDTGNTHNPPIASSTNPVACS